MPILQFRGEISDVVGRNRRILHLGVKIAFIAKLFIPAPIGPDHRKRREQNIGSFGANPRIFQIETTVGDEQTAVHLLHLETATLAEREAIDLRMDIGTVHSEIF